MRRNHSLVLAALASAIMMPATAAYAAAPQQPEVSITIDGIIGHLMPHSRGATISGTYSCTVDNLEAISTGTELSERIGRGHHLVHGNGGLNETSFNFNGTGPCDGQEHPWTSDIKPDRGKFLAGSATASVTNFTVCDEFTGCVSTTIFDQAVTLSK